MRSDNLLQIFNEPVDFGSNYCLYIMTCLVCILQKIENSKRRKDDLNMTRKSKDKKVFFLLDIHIIILLCFCVPFLCMPMEVCFECLSLYYALCMFWSLDLFLWCYTVSVSLLPCFSLSVSFACLLMHSHWHP